MKRLIAIAAILVAAITTSFAQSGKNIYLKYSDAENVSAVYVSTAMFRMIGKLPDMNVEGENVNLAPIIKSLSGLYVLSSENPSINASLKSDVDRFISSGNYELLMEAKDSGELVRMYTVGDEVTVTSFVMMAVDGAETTFICLDGKMNRTDLENLLAEQME